MPSRGLCRQQVSLHYHKSHRPKSWLLRSLKAIENARKGVRINAVAPSYVSGPMMNKFLADAPGLKASMLGDLAIGRLVDPEEVADAVVFLASTSASYVNGHTLVVDGGSSLQLANMPFSDP